jgi:predicted TIM-barrel fold metal-dependent hydrolase
VRGDGPALAAERKARNRDQEPPHGDQSILSSLSFPATFKNLADLSRLPWFEAYDDRVVLADESIGPVIDMHAHLALAYVRPMQLDLYARSAHTEHYLPSCCALDLDVYVNKNFTQRDLAEMKRDLTVRSLGSTGMRKTHTVPNLLREMRELGVTHSVVLPIDFPALSENWVHATAAARSTEQLISFGSVHPYARNVRDKLDEQVARGIRGVKVHPAVQLVRPDDARAMVLYRLCGERNLPVLWHCGPVGIEPRLGRYLSQVRFYEKPIAENPKTTFILGHSGALQRVEALALVKRYPNVLLETSSQSLSGLREMVDGVDTTRIMLGSDWPFYHQAIALAKVLMATESRRDVRHRILYENAARVLGLERRSSARLPAS